MNQTKQNLSIRWFYLVIGVIAMLFAGILYAWSILKSPFSAEFGWGASNLALNFTFAMCFFCIGGLLGAQLAKRVGHKISIITAGILAGLGFSLTATLSGESVVTLYLTYGILAGLGIGISYNVVIATVSTWFPDQKGLCSGCLMMGFGTSALLLGNVADSLIKSALGWRAAYIILGSAIALVMVIAALLLKKPGEHTALPQPKAAKSAESDKYERKDFTSAQMLRRPSFWMGFTFLVFMSAVGSSVISFAKDLALSVHAPETLAVTLVGVLSVCNGLGRIITGALYDAIGRANTMRCASVIAVSAAGIILLAVSISSLPLCILGLCLAGLSYGSCATTTATFTSLFYGMKHYSTNMAFMTFNAMGGSFIATLSSKVLEASGDYAATFVMLLAFTIVASIINLFIRKP